MAQPEDKILADAIDVLVTAHLQGAAQAVKAQNIAALVQSLERAVALYEKHPTQVHAPGNHLETLIRLIRLARRVCDAHRRPADDLRAIEAKAEILRHSQLH